ncbi:MAG: hypothetical protein NVSMB2_25700 [Chloroflexota bacterium]
MHDITHFEGRGIPAVFVASDVFVDAAETQARALGFTSAERVFVAHPIQDRTDAEMAALAEQAVDEVVRRISAGGVS